MKDLKTFRRQWSTDQKKLRGMLTSGDQVDESKELFYSQHGVLHSKAVSESDSWSFADQVFRGISQDQLRIIPENHQHSMIWILWHISRIEDVTMNILVADDIQVYLQDGWIQELKSPIHHTGNNIEDLVVMRLSQQYKKESILENYLKTFEQT